MGHFQEILGLKAIMYSKTNSPLKISSTLHICLWMLFAFEKCSTWIQNSNNCAINIDACLWFKTLTCVMQLTW